MKSTLVKKKFGEKIYRVEQPNNRVIKIITQSDYETNGESVLIVKETPLCSLVLNQMTTTSVIIKAMTKVSLKPKVGHIDEYYEELLIEKGACVEMEYFENSWYILSSDGLKLN